MTGFLLGTSQPRGLLLETINQASSNNQVPCTKRAFQDYSQAREDGISHENQPCHLSGGGGGGHGKNMSKTDSGGETEGAHL